MCKVSRHDGSPFRVDCIEKEVCLQVDQFWYQTIPTLRPAPQIVPNDAWQIQQGKQSSSEISAADGILFKIDLRIQGVPQDSGLKDQGRMTQIQEVVDKLRTEYRTESDITDWSET